MDIADCRSFQEGTSKLFLRNVLSDDCCSSLFVEAIQIPLERQGGLCGAQFESTLLLCCSMLCLSEGMCTGMGISSAQSASVAFFEQDFSRMCIHRDNLYTCFGPGTETWEK